MADIETDRPMTHCACLTQLFKSHRLVKIALSERDYDDNLSKYKSNIKRKQ